MFPGVDTRKNIPAAATAAREGLRMMTKINNIIISSYRNYSMIQEVVQKVGLSRSQVGMFIRELGAEWRSQYLCALMLEAIPYWKEGGPDRTQEVLVKYSTFLSQIKDMDLEEAHAFKTVLNVSTTFILPVAPLANTSTGETTDVCTGPGEIWALADGRTEPPDGVAAREPRKGQ